MARYLRIIYWHTNYYRVWCVLRTTNSSVTKVGAVRITECYKYNFMYCFLTESVPETRNGIFKWNYVLILQGKYTVYRRTGRKHSSHAILQVLWYTMKIRQMCTPRSVRGPFGKFSAILWDQAISNVLGPAHFGSSIEMSIFEFALPAPTLWSFFLTLKYYFLDPVA